MSNSLQETIDQVKLYMEMASRQTASGPAGTRVLHTLVTMLARHALTPEQQVQVEGILELHEECVIHNGEIKRLSN